MPCREEWRIYWLLAWQCKQGGLWAQRQRLAPYKPDPAQHSKHNPRPVKRMARILELAFERGECALRRKGLANGRALSQVLDGKAEFVDVDAPVAAAFE